MTNYLADGHLIFPVDATDIDTARRVVDGVIHSVARGLDESGLQYSLSWDVQDADVEADTDSARVVLDGDPGEIEAALDALPVGSIVTSESLTSFDMFLKQTMVSTRRSAWYQAGVSKPFDSGFLARNYAPLVVLR